MIAAGSSGNWTAAGSLGNWTAAVIQSFAKGHPETYLRKIEICLNYLGRGQTR